MSRTSDPRKANGHRRRELFRRVLAEESVCGICGQPVDKGLRGVRALNCRTGRLALHPLSPTLDEIVPVSLGGDPLDRANVRLAHLACNERRGNGLARDGGPRDAAPKPPTMPTRDWSR